MAIQVNVITSPALPGVVIQLDGHGAKRLAMTLVVFLALTKHACVVASLLAIAPENATRPPTVVSTLRALSRLCVRKSDPRASAFIRGFMLNCIAA